MHPAMKHINQFLGNSALGIVGAGHLGQAIAHGLLESGFPRSQLTICHRGSPGTHSQLVASGLPDCLAERREVVRRSKIMLYTVRPQDYQVLMDCTLRSDSLLVSFLAGISLARLPISLPEEQRVRVMISTPDTLRQKNGIAAMYPADNLIVHELLVALKLRVFTLQSEKDLHAFTALGSCLPIVLTYWESLGHQVDLAALLAMAAKYQLPDYSQVVAWARAVQPGGLSSEELTVYIGKAATPGGVTEAILREIMAGECLTVALEHGVERSRQLGSTANGG